jgi:hypothetical protein
MTVNAAALRINMRQYFLLLSLFQNSFIISLRFRIWAHLRRKAPQTEGQGGISGFKIPNKTKARLVGIQK